MWKPKPGTQLGGLLAIMAGLSLLLAACGSTNGTTAPGLAATAPATIVSGPPAPPDPTTPPTPANDWLQYAFNAQHSGSDGAQEVLVTPATVARLQKLFQVTLPASADGAPVYLAGVSTSGGPRNLVFVTSREGDIIALDALSGTQVWRKSNPAGSCRINNGSSPCYTTSSPALDPNRQFVYSYGLDGYVHKYRVGDGSEITGGGWPELTSRKPFDEKGSSALSLATTGDGNTYLYMVHGGYPGDRGDYQGHLTAINLKDGSQHVFNTVCSEQVDVHFTEPGQPNCPAKQTALWPRVGVVYDQATNRIFSTTGNGPFDPAHNYWGDTVLALHPDGTAGPNGQPVDGYTPTNFQALQDRDADIGSTAPAILPVPANSRVQHLAVQGGKDAQLRLINLENLSGQGGPGHTGGEIAITPIPQGGGMLTAPAVWVNPVDSSTWLFVTTNSGIAGLRLEVDGSGNPSLKTVWQGREGGFSPIVAGNVLYYARSGAIIALDPASGKQLWRDSAVGSIHWESPIMVNGVLYITDGDNHLTAYSLDGKFPATANNTAAFTRVWSRTDQPVAAGQVNRTWLWGPQPFYTTSESYNEAPGNQRLVQYYDKSRMEITRPNGDQSSPYYVTNGLLAAEMIRGQVQTGDNQFEARSPAQVGVAGDPDDTTGPTYATLGQVLNAPAQPAGTTLTATLNRAGQAGQDSSLTRFKVTASHYVDTTKHTIAAPFWDFLNTQGPVYDSSAQLVTRPLFDPVFYATGLPLTEAYWSRVKVGGQVKPVLVQAFERRVLTYTPSNPAGFQVEMGNVGRHYYQWRYGQLSATRVISGYNANQTVTLHTGDTFEVRFAPNGLDWAINFSDQTLVKQLSGPTNGDQGTFQALKPGQTTLYATGTAHCAKDQPCPKIAVGVTLTLSIS